MIYLRKLLASRFVSRAAALVLSVVVGLAIGQIVFDSNLNQLVLHSQDACLNVAKFFERKGMDPESTWVLENIEEIDILPDGEPASIQYKTALEKGFASTEFKPRKWHQGYGIPIGYPGGLFEQEGCYNLLYGDRILSIVNASENRLVISEVINHSITGAQVSKTPAMIFEMVKASVSSKLNSRKADTSPHLRFKQYIEYTTSYLENGMIQKETHMIQVVKGIRLLTLKSQVVPTLKPTSKSNECLPSEKKIKKVKDSDCLIDVPTLDI